MERRGLPIARSADVAFISIDAAEAAQRVRQSAKQVG